MHVYLVSHLLRFALVTVPPVIPLSWPHTNLYLPSKTFFFFQPFFNLSFPIHLSRKVGHSFICSYSKSTRTSFTASDFLSIFAITALPHSTSRLRLLWKLRGFHIYLYIWMPDTMFGTLVNNKSLWMNRWIQ